MVVFVVSVNKADSEFLPRLIKMNGGSTCMFVECGLMEDVLSKFMKKFQQMYYCRVRSYGARELFFLSKIDDIDFDGRGLGKETRELTWSNAVHCCFVIL